MKIAVIGCRGTLGAAMMKEWNRESFLRPLASDFTPSDELAGLDLPDFDVTSRRFSLETLEDIAPDVIVNLSGLNFVDWAERHPNSTRTVHVQGAANLREAARRTGALLVQIGCGEIFYETSPQTAPKSETDEPNPESVYAKTKLDAERAASEAPQWLIVRTSVLFGEIGEQSAGNIADTILKSSRRTRSLRVLNDRRASMTYTLDFLRGLRFLIHSGQTGLYHLVNGGSATLAEFASELLRQCGLKHHEIAGITSEEYGDIAPRTANSALCSARYRALPGAYPLPDWQTALQEFIDSRQRL